MILRAGPSCSATTGPTSRTRDPDLPNQIIFTCLSSDIIAHELTHGIVHRLRPHFSEATNADVFAWHEAFADLIALFQHFAYPDVVKDAVNATSTHIDGSVVHFSIWPANSVNLPAGARRCGRR